MADRELVSMDVGDGVTARILRGDDGRTYWSAGTPSWQTVAPADPFVVAVPAGTLVAGQIAPGGERIELSAPIEASELVTADGWFLALLRGKFSSTEVFAVTRDGAGQIVPFMWDGEVDREPVDDADAACPACAGTAWDVLYREVYGDRHRAVVCRTCGRNANPGVEQLVLSDAPSRPEDALLYAPGLGPDSDLADVLAAAPFPVYALEDRPYELGTVSSDDAAITGVSLRQGDVKARTSRDPHGGDPEARARRALVAEMRSRAWSETIAEGQKSWEAMFLRRDELARPAQARAGRAAAAATTIAVDGQDREFTLVAADDLWAAAADHDGLRLLVLASKTRPEKVRLKAVSG